MKSQGSWLEPWRNDLRLGAVRENDEVLLSVSSDSPWEGRLRFDVPRHRVIFNMPVNYTRLNEFPEWFTVEGDALYEASVNGQAQTLCGAECIRGIALSVDAGRPAWIRIKRLPGPPYAQEAK